MNTNTSSIRQMQDRLFPQWRRAGLSTTFAIILLLIIGQSIVQYTITRRSNDEQIINTAAQQGILSQRIAKSALLLTRQLPDSSDATQKANLDELNQSIRNWQNSYQSLTAETGKLSDDNDDEINTLYAKQKPVYETILAASQCLSNLYTPSASHSECNIDSNSHLQTILSNEPVFLKFQEQIVAAYQEEAAAEYTALSRTQILITVGQITAIILMGIFILQPIIGRVQKMLETVRASEEQFRLLTERATDMLAEHSLDGTFLYVSPVVENILGYTPQELAGRSIYELFDPEEGPAMRHVHNTIAQSKTVMTTSYRLRHKNGEYRWVETTARGIRNPRTDEPESLVAASRDVTERREAERKIQMQNETLVKTNRDLAITRREAEEAVRIKSEFLATMSHELRTPLNAIIGYSEIVEAGMAGEITPKTSDFQKRILVNASHLLNLINDILDLSKIEAGRIELLSEPFSVHDLLRTVIYQTKALADHKGLNLITEVDPGFAETVIGDSDRLKQVLINLVSNAIKFTDKGDVRVHIRAVGIESWEIAVNDTGIGIPLHAQQYIFDEFRQVDGSTQRQYGGTGLGLSIVRKLVMLMSGTIRLKSAPGEGSTFIVTLPLLTIAESVNHIS